MGLGRRYFVLMDALPESEIAHMLGRVVEDKLNPLRSYVPFDFGDQDTEMFDDGATSDSKRSSSLQPDDIIPDLLPSPVNYTTRSDFVTSTTDWSLGAGLADLVGVEQSASSGRSISLDAAEVRCYAMPNTMRHFERLMADARYGRQVRRLLASSRAGHAYFVTGLLTARDGAVSEFRLRSRQTGLELTFPLLEATGIAPVALFGGMGNPQVKPAVGSTETLVRSMTIRGEVIVAVSYDIIRSARSFTFAGNPFGSRSIVNAGPKLAKPKHLSFGGRLRHHPYDLDDDSDEEEEKEAEDDDDSGSDTDDDDEGRISRLRDCAPVTEEEEEEEEEIGFVEGDSAWHTYLDRDSTDSASKEASFCLNLHSQ